MGNFERVKEAVSLTAYAERHLEKLRGLYICPCCKSGTGPNKSPAFRIKEQERYWSCFSCDRHGDIFDLAGYVHGTQDKREQLQAVADWANIPLEGTGRTQGRAAKQNSETHAKADRSEKAPDYTEGRGRERARVSQARENMRAAAGGGEGREAFEYLQARGFTPGEIDRFGFGCYRTDPKDRNGWKDAAGAWANGWRVVLPWRGGGYYHLDRAVSGDVSDRKYIKPKSDDVGAQPATWEGALSEGCVFVCEGLLDAYAIEAMGYSALPLAGTGYARALEAVSAQGYQGTVILALDGDGPGRDAQGKAAALCETLGLKHHEADLSALTGAKDVCEAFAANRDGARAALEATRIRATMQAEDLEALHVMRPGAVAAAIWNRDGYEEPIPTGFHGLDSVMNGGLRSGLVVLGAVSSAGKTTLLVQLADTIAAGGRPVLFVTIEQSAREIVAKSLSRLMAGRGYRGVTLWEMWSGDYRDLWPEEKEAAFLGCVEEYTRDVSPRLFILSADEQPKVGEVRAAAFAVAAECGVSPVVFVDYLQILAPENERMTDKQAADGNVSGLRRLARDMRTPVITTSSLNRASYSGVIDMESFKESGGIEYGADLLMGLQPYHMAERMEGESSKDKREKRAKDITGEFRREAVRRCELVVLKNRNGRIPGEPIPLTFHAASSLFVEGIGE